MVHPSPELQFSHHRGADMSSSPGLISSSYGASKTAPSLSSMAFPLVPKEKFVKPQAITTLDDQQEQQQQHWQPPSTENTNLFEDFRKTGWDIKIAKPATLTPYFPKDLIKLELPSDEFHGVLERIQRFLCQNSIQAQFENDPASAKLQTVGRVEMWLKFWEGVGGNVFYIDVQRYRGDRVEFKNIVHGLLDVAKGMNVPNTGAIPVDMTPERIQTIESVIPKVSLPTDTTQSHQSCVSIPGVVTRTINVVHASLMSRNLGERREALRSLLIFTDLRRTMSEAAWPIALVVLEGKAPVRSDATTEPPQAELAAKCRDIQYVLFHILQHGEFDGDDEICRDLEEANVKDDVSSLLLFMPSPQDVTKPLPPQYLEYTKEIFHMAMVILVNSLEVATCVANASNNINHNNNINNNKNLELEQVGTQFLRSWETNIGTDLYDKLLECIEQAEHQLTNGYLACKALRLLAGPIPAIRDRLRKDTRASNCVHKAFSAGRSCHSMLEVESDRLRSLFHVA